MTTATFSDRLAEVAGPIVVKEVRQGLRARVFGIFFGLLLVACFVVAIVAAAEFDRHANLDLGPDYFRVFLGALGVVEFFVIPYTAYRAMAREREDETWVLLVLTGLGPRRIVRGKVTSALAQGLLFASACAPFVLFSYYLNGIDLPTVLVALLLSAAWSCMLVCIAVAAATQAHSRIGRAIVHFLVLGVLLGATFGGIAFAVFFSEEGGRHLRQEHGFQLFCAALVVWSLSTAWVMTEGAASGLALLSENAAKGPRLALSAQVLFGLAVTLVACALVDKVDSKLPLVGSIVSSFYLGVAGLFAVSEHDGHPPAFASGRWLSRPGALRSFKLVLLLFALSTAAWGAVHGIGDVGARHLRGELAAPLYAIVYLSLGVLVGRLSPLKLVGEPIATRLGVAVVLVLGTTVPLLLAELLRRSVDRKAMWMITPLGIEQIDRQNQYSSTGFNLLVAAALLFGFLAWTVLSVRDVERRA